MGNFFGWTEGKEGAWDGNEVVVHSEMGKVCIRYVNDVVTESTNKPKGFMARWAWLKIV
jgi:hypothetical protein